MKSNSQKVKECQVRKLEEAGFNLETITQDDYPAVKKKLGWAESTFKTALRYLGRPSKGLTEHIRDYIPTDQDIKAVSEALGSFGKTLIFLGCRISEMWDIRILNKHKAIIPTQKNGDTIVLNLDVMGKREKAALLEWAMVDKHKLSKAKVYRILEELKEQGKLDRRCVPHSFRHRLITNLAHVGKTAEQICLITGQKSPKTVYRYMHGTPTAATEARMAAAQIVRRAKVQKWSTDNLKSQKLRLLNSQMN